MGRKQQPRQNEQQVGGGHRCCRPMQIYMMLSSVETGLEHFLRRAGLVGLLQRAQRRRDIVCAADVVLAVSAKLSPSEAAIAAEAAITCAPSPVVDGA